MIDIEGQLFGEDIQHFSFPAGYQIKAMDALARLEAFRQLSSASFGGTGLN